MPKAMPFVENGETTGYMVFCPACACGHLFNIKPGDNGFGHQKPVWKFVNGDVENPTFVDSMLVKTGHYAKTQRPGDACWCTYEERYGKPAPYECSVCHSHVANGKIQFLGDSTHKLAGQTVDLPDFATMKAGE